MKFALLTTTAILALAGAAQADVEFVKGTVALDVSYFDGPDLYIIDAGVDAAFNVGNFGFQFGGANVTWTDFGDSYSYGTFDLHFYRNTAAGHKFGAYVVSGGGFGPFGGGSTSYGVEGMFGFGNLDIEIAAGATDYSSFFSATFGNAGASLYYGIGENFEVSASYNYTFDFDGPYSESNFSVGASYTIPNSAVSINGSYETFDGADIYGIGLSWSFGPNQDERLFGHNSGFAVFGP